MDEVLSRNSFCGRYLLFLNFREKEKDWGRFGEWMTPEWKRNFSVWLDGVKKHLQSRGINNNQWALHPFDETLCDELYDFCRFVKDADRSISIFANSFGKGPGEYRRFKNLIDIWSFQDSYIAAHKDWLNEIKSFGKEVFMHDCLGPGKGNDPYSYYRLMPWRAFQLGLTGVGFWVYYDGVNYKNGPLPWDDTMVSMGYYGVVYSSQFSPVNTQGENIVPSRRWEAWREGLEDYQYLYEVQQAINKIIKTNPVMAAKAKEQLSVQLTRVIKSADDPDVVYEARKTLSDLLLEVVDVNKP
jgi:hypothetical protein